ncbi:hypothetical protein PF008_g10123 [Phytophthora fragariae]|uniref:GAF domain-containing protein n=1 Tax=Phytophthora fragariae TaxID=53985 RepID=A0A6G0RWA0_9STRA|nr:hypothetical protein PF008_g10123 [Phytophthora fragariae]
MPAVNSRSSSSSPTRGDEFTDESQRDARRTNNPVGFSAASSFFIIHESSSTVILPNGGDRSPPKLRRSGDDNGPPVSIRSRQGGSSSTGLRKKKSRSKTPASAPGSQSTSLLDTPAALRNSSTALSPTVYEGHEDEEVNDLNQTASEAHTDNVQTASKTKRTMELSILNRCGSAPDLPMHSPLSANVYSSSKKRTLQSSNGASPHLATLQRSRLTPLPANTRAKVVKPDPLLTVDEVEPKQSTGDGFDSASLFSRDPLLQEKMRQDTQTIASLKQRLVLLEREISASTKYRHMTEKQIAQLSLETQRLQGEKTQQQARINELDRTVLRQRHEYDKLAARYAAVYANLQKLVDQQQNPSDNSAQQSALQALARENQDFLRKLRVLEARHAEDKALTSNQEKKIKRVKAEIEALQHMHDAKTRDDDLDESSSDTDQVSRLSRPKKRADSDVNYGGRLNSASSTASITSSTPRRAGSPVRVQAVQNAALGHLVTAEAYQYIDPNILKVLEKVDSQFSITNAINLSVVLKKWLNSCVHIVCSTHLPSVLQTLLKRMCELLHCEHVALFTVDYAARKLVAVSSERGPERWELPLDKGISGYAARHNVLCNVPCANDDPRFFSSTDSITSTTSREVLALPIVHELQLYLEAHLAGSGDSNRTKVNGHGVFAVLRAWNTTHQKPFSPNDQILGSLLAVQAGIILRQTIVTKTLQKINHKTHQILQMPSEIIAKASTGLHTMRSPHPEVSGSPSAGSSSPLASEYPGASLIPSVVQLVAVAQKELGECLGIKQLRIFVFDAAANKLWHAGEQLPHDTGDGSTPTVVRRYVSAQASLCALLLRSDATSTILTEPSAQAAFNDTVDIPGGARGLYLVPILSPWGNGALPFGVVQVARVAKARLSASPFALTASEGAGSSIMAGSVADIVANNEREAAQQTEDRLMLELLGLFCRVFAGLLHHVVAQQLHDACPPELLQAQLATLSNHLDGLAARRAAEDDSEDDADDAPTQTSHRDDRASSSHRSGRHASIAAVRVSPPPSRSARRAVSADSKHRAAPEPQRASSSPTNSSVKSRVGDGDHVQRQSTPIGTVGYEVLPATDADAAADNTSAATVDAAAGATIAVDAMNAEASALDPEGDEHELLGPDPEQHEAIETVIGTGEDPASLAEDYAATLDSNIYATAPDDERLVNEADVGAYDPTLWPGAGNAGTYEEGAAWEYGTVEDAALANEDEDITSTAVMRGSHISTNSTYAIDLHLFRNTSSAETDEPRGAL